MESRFGARQKKKNNESEGKRGRWIDRLSCCILFSQSNSLLDPNSGNSPAASLPLLPSFSFFIPWEVAKFGAEFCVYARPRSSSVRFVAPAPNSRATPLAIYALFLRLRTHQEGRRRARTAATSRRVKDQWHLGANLGISHWGKENSKLICGYRAKECERDMNGRL